MPDRTPAPDIAAADAAFRERRERITPRVNRCCCCGHFVGQTFTGYEHDRMSDRGRLWCDRCAMLVDARERPSPSTPVEGVPL